VVSELDSQLEGHGFESHPMLDGNSVIVKPGSIHAPNPVADLIKLFFLLFPILDVQLECLLHIEKKTFYNKM